MYLTDLHCHLLPALDDGAFLEEETLQMAQIAVSGRTRAIVCTPHGILQNAGYSIRDLLYAFHCICVRLRESGIPLRLYLGQEIFVDEHYRELPSLLQQKRLLTINHSVYPLVEFDPCTSELAVLRKLSFLVSAGFVPIVAHPERYGFLQNDPSAAVRLKKCGAFLQIDKDSLNGSFGHAAAWTADILLTGRTADFVASDAHSPYRRTPSLRDVHARISETYSMDYADHLLCHNPRKVIRNEEIHPY